MRPDSSVTTMHGFSRNCTCFDNVRETAYREVLDAKRAGKSLSDFQLRLEGVAPEINLHFPEALPLSEIRAIAMSVAKWTWRNIEILDAIDDAAADLGVDRTAAFQSELFES